MKLLPEFFWTSEQYRWVRSLILACYMMVSATLVAASLSNKNIWISAGSGMIAYILVLRLRDRRIL